MSATDIDRLFDELLSRRSLFKDRRVLSIDYVPDELPHREREIARLATILATALRGGRPSNVFCYGHTGTGKTAVVKFVLKKLFEKARSRNLKFKAAYVNTRIYNTPYRALYKIAEELGIRGIPKTGLAVADVFEKVKREIDRFDCLTIIVLDEIDYLVKREGGNDLLYQLTRINNMLSRSQVSLIGVTNDLRFRDFLEARVLSSLCEETIVFHPYTAEQLYDILKQRAALAFVDGAVEDSALRLIAALAAREHGDARRAIDLLRVAGEIAEREGADCVREEHVWKAYEEVERDLVSAAVSGLPLQEKLVLLAIALLSRSKRQITTGLVKHAYEKVCAALGVAPVSHRRLTDILNNLETLGLISCALVSLGRYGRTKLIKLEVRPKDVISILARDPRFAELVSQIRF